MKYIKREIEKDEGNKLFVKNEIFNYVKWL